MLLLLSDNHKRHLELLKDFDEKVIKEFCRIAIDHLRSGNKSKIYQNASQKLNIDPDNIQNVITGIVYLLTEATKTTVSEISFRDSISILGFKEHISEELVKTYLENQEEIRSLLTTLKISIPYYNNLEWRLDVQIASRSLYRPLEPKFLLKLQLKKDEKFENILLEADPSDIIHITEVLEQALHEAKSHHCRRIMRTIK